MFLKELCKTFKNTFYKEHLWTPASKLTWRRLAQIFFSLEYNLLSKHFLKTILFVKQLEKGLSTYVFLNFLYLGILTPLILVNLVFQVSVFITKILNDQSLFAWRHVPNVRIFCHRLYDFEFDVILLLSVNQLVKWTNFESCFWVQIRGAFRT